MPILIDDYNWSETEKNVYVAVPLKGTKSSSAKVFCSNEYLKVSFPPFLFEILLFDTIDDDASVARFKNSAITFNLVKENPKLWNKLVSPHSGNKAVMKTKREEALLYLQKKAEKQEEEKREIKEKNKKYSLKEMMKLEENDRTRIAEVKENERVRTMKEFEEWKEKQRLEAEKEKHELEKNFSLLKEKKLKEKKENEFRKNALIFDEPDFEEEIESCTITEIEEEPLEIPEKVKKPTAAEQLSKKPTKTKPAGPRLSGKITFSFTPRVFPTPQRESKAAEENEWLQKQANARKQFEVEEPDLAEHEKDPMWLKDKGRQLFANENYQGAVNAYSLAIKIQPGMPILYINRAACHLKMRNLFKCAEDCSTALDIMVPKVEANAKGRLKAHLRRAAAYCEMELYVEALQDYEAALAIEPKNEEIIEDARKLRYVIQSPES